MTKFKVGDNVRIKTEDEDNVGASLVAKVFSRYLKNHENVLTVSAVRPITGTTVVYLDFEELAETGFYSSRFELISTNFNATEKDLEDLLNDCV